MMSMLSTIQVEGEMAQNTADKVSPARAERPRAALEEARRLLFGWPGAWVVGRLCGALLLLLSGYEIGAH